MLRVWKIQITLIFIRPIDQGLLKNSYCHSFYLSCSLPMCQMSASATLDFYQLFRLSSLSACSLKLHLILVRMSLETWPLSSAHVLKTILHPCHYWHKAHQNCEASIWQFPWYCSSASWTEPHTYTCQAPVSFWSSASGTPTFFKHCHSPSVSWLAVFCPFVCLCPWHPNSSFGTKYLWTVCRCPGSWSMAPYLGLSPRCGSPGNG